MSGALTVLVSGFFAIASGTANQVKITSHERWVLAGSLGFYILSSIAALLVNLPRKVEMADSDKLQEYVDEDWDATGWDQRVAQVSVEYLRSIKTLNAKNARFLAGAIVLEIAGMALTAVVAVLVVGHVTAF